MITEIGNNVGRLIEIPKSLDSHSKKERKTGDQSLQIVLGKLFNHQDNYSALDRLGIYEEFTDFLQSYVTRLHDRDFNQASKEASNFARELIYTKECFSDY